MRCPALPQLRGLAALGLDEVRGAANDQRNLLPPIISAVKALATLGEISDVLREVWGTYDAPA